MDVGKTNFVISVLWNLQLTTFVLYLLDKAAFNH